MQLFLVTADYVCVKIHWYVHEMIRAVDDGDEDSNVVTVPTMANKKPAVYAIHYYSLKFGCRQLL
jgi:hypothetical protein